VVAPLPGGRCRIVAAVDEAPSSPDAGNVQALPDARAPGMAPLHRVVWGSGFRVHHRAADACRAGRLPPAGDAAHAHGPAGGQGMNTGIHDGYALGLAFAEGPPRHVRGTAPAGRPAGRRLYRAHDPYRHRRLRPGPPLRNTALPVLSRVPAFRRTHATEPAELSSR
jgi:2-polyprenyl-6-methoxyphenol hydroxylase-like FAD-dependent oxidoreductase